MSWRRFFRRAHWDDERAEELRAHLQHEIDDNLARGLPPLEARRAAHRKLGNTTRVREEIYEMNTIGVLETAWKDLRYGLRLLRRDRTFAVVAVLTLALGTGANAAIFQLMNALRLRALPVERPHELVSVDIDTKDSGRVGRFRSRRARFTEPQWQAIRDQQQAFSPLFAWGVTTWNIATDGSYRAAQGLYVSGGFFEGLGVEPQLGRLITDADDQRGCSAPGAVLTDGFWRARYGGSAAAIGSTITLDGRSFEIIGVTRPGFFGVEVGRSFDVAVPLCAEPALLGPNTGIGSRDTWFLDLMGRLAPGVTPQQAGAQLASISPRVFESTLPERYDARLARAYLAFTLTATAAPTGVSGLRQAYQMELWILLGATGLVLLIACANLANLMLARAGARAREFAVRLAIGASRGRIVRQLLAESLLLAGFGALGGALLAGWLGSSLVAFLSTDNSPLFLDLTPDWRLFSFITLLAIGCCLLFGLSPALKATGTDPGAALQAGGRSATDSRERFALRRGLVVVQVALSMVLIVGALLFTRSLRNLVTQETGFSQDGVLAVTVDLRQAAVAPDGRPQAFARVLERVRAVPGVQYAAQADIVPMSGSSWNQNVSVDGVTQDGFSKFNRVGPDYFRATGTTLVAGRPFGPEDRPGATETVIVNQSFARRFFGQEQPIGKTFQLGETLGRPRVRYEIVGVVGDTKYNDLREPFEPIGYFAAAQDTEPLPELTLVVRAGVPLASITPALTQAILEVQPRSTVAYDTMRGFVRDALVTERLMASLSGFLGLLAMLIATIGLYGVVSYLVSRRKVEIGIRMALGADAAAIVRMVIGESSLLLAAGTVIGAMLAVFAARWVSALLYGLDPWDPVSLALAGSLLGLVCLLGAWIPARRAARTAPSVALRD